MEPGHLKERMNRFVQDDLSLCLLILTARDIDKMARGIVKSKDNILPRSFIELTVWRCRFVIGVVFGEQRSSGIAGHSISVWSYSQASRQAHLSIHPVFKESGYKPLAIPVDAVGPVGLATAPAEGNDI